jgi:ribosomal protein L3
MNAQAQIAIHLNIAASAITRCEEWANVWFVVIVGRGARFVSKKVVKEMKGITVIELNTYRKKGINAYLVGTDANGKSLGHEHMMYGKPKAGQEDAAHKSKKHIVEVRIDNLPDGKYIYKEAGGADFNKARYGEIVLKDGQIQ